MLRSSVSAGSQVLGREIKGSGGESERGFMLCWELLPGSICFSFCSWHDVLSLTQQLFPLPLNPGHGFACAARRCEVGGSFPHSPEVCATVMMKTTARGFTLLFILPLNSVHLPFSLALRCQAPHFRPFSSGGAHPPPQGRGARLPAGSGRRDLTQSPAPPSPLYLQIHFNSFPSPSSPRPHSDLGSPSAPREVLVRHK